MVRLKNSKFEARSTFVSKPKPRTQIKKFAKKIRIFPTVFKTAAVKFFIDFIIISFYFAIPDVFSGYLLTDVSINPHANINSAAFKTQWYMLLR